MLRSLSVLAVVVTVLSTGCSTDLDINAPYKESTVVYALFNMREDTHYVKINKAFLGEGNALTYAQIADSNEYDEEDIELAQVVRIQNGVEVATFPLQPITITNRVPGTFYAPNQRLYYFVGQQQLLPITQVPVYLDPASTYKVKLRVKGKDIEASTNVVNDFTIQSIDQDTALTSSAARLNFMNASGTDYGQFEFNWNSRTNGKRYVVRWRFRYDEVRGTEVTSRSIERELGRRITNNAAVSEEMSAVLTGPTFYSTLASSIPADPTVDKRVFRGMDFLVTVANEEFNTFLSLSEPISGIIEDRPVYTNVTNATGIVASRYTKNVIGKRLSFNSLRELVTGPYTGQLRFCSAVDPGSEYSCQ
jgi:hypothetical protein